MPLVRVSSWPPNSRCTRIIVKHDLGRSNHPLQALGILFCMRSVWILRARIDPFKPIIPPLDLRYSRGFIYTRISDFIFVSLRLAKMFSSRSKSISIVLPSFPWNSFLFQSKTLQPSCCTISTISIQCIPCTMHHRKILSVDAKWYSTSKFQLLRAKKLHLRNPKHSDCFVRVLREIARVPYLVGRIPPCDPMLIGARVEAQKRKSVSWNGSVGAHVME